MRFDRVTVNTVHSAMKEDADGCLLVDVRDAADFAGEHIAGSVNLPLADLPTRLATICRSRLVYLVCKTGKLATFAAAELENRGFDNVQVVAGGLKAWHAQGFPLVGSQF